MLTLLSAYQVRWGLLWCTGRQYMRCLASWRCSGATSSLQQNQTRGQRLHLFASLCFRSLPCALRGSPSLFISVPAPCYPSTALCQPSTLHLVRRLTNLLIWLSVACCWLMYCPPTHVPNEQLPQLARTCVAQLMITDPARSPLPFVPGPSKALIVLHVELLVALVLAIRVSG